MTTTAQQRYARKMAEKRQVKAMKNEIELRKQYASNQSKVTMDNALVRARSDLSLMERRLLVMGISKLDSMPNRVASLTVTISALEFASTFHIGDATTYAQLKETVNTFFEKEVRFKTPVQLDNEFGEPSGIKVRRQRWVSSIAYVEGEGTVSMNFAPELRSRLLDIKGHFTSYDLVRIADLSSSYGYKLFELISQYKRTGLCMISVDDFNEAMAVPASYLSNFAFIRNNIITPAIRDLKENAKVDVAVKYEKKGRKISMIKLSFNYYGETNDAIKAEILANGKAKRKSKKVIEGEYTSVSDVDDIPF